MSQFVHGLEAVEARIAKLVATEPHRAVDFYEALLAGCQEKADAVRDQGEVGHFFAGLAAGSVRARQAAGVGPDDTARVILRRLYAVPIRALWETT